MYSKLDHVLGIMSERQDFLPKKDQEKEIRSEIQIRPTSHDPKGCPNISPSRHLSHLQELPGAGAGGNGDDEDDENDNRKNQKKVVEPGISTRPTSQDPEGCPDVPPPSSHHLSELRGFREVRGEEEEKEQRQLGKSEVAEDDDGFRTPESLEHRIPVITACPPAPKKSRPKISPGKRSRTTAELLDLSDEVESLFSPKIKKFRREEEDGTSTKMHIRYCCKRLFATVVQQ